MSSQRHDIHGTFLDGPVDFTIPKQDWQCYKPSSTVLLHPLAHAIVQVTFYGPRYGQAFLQIHLPS